MRNSAHAVVVLFGITLTTVAAADSHPVPLVKSAALEKLARPAALTASEVKEQLAQFTTGINRCYLDAAGELKSTGRLEIMLTIHRTGILDAIDVSTPGLGAKPTHKVAACVKDMLGHLQFPARRLSTSAILPFEYERTVTPDAGPQYSCWNANGCR